MAEDNGGTGNSAISPQAEQVKQAASYGYPSHRGSGPSGADIKPKGGSPVNNKSAK